MVFISAASGLASDLRWAEGTAHLYDVVHWHGHAEGVSVAQARGLVQALIAAQKPLVVTVPPDVLDTALPAFGDEERVDAFADLYPVAAVVARDGGSAEAVWRARGRTCLALAEGEDEQVSANLYRAVISRSPSLSTARADPAEPGGAPGGGRPPLTPCPSYRQQRHSATWTCCAAVLAPGRWATDAGPPRAGPAAADASAARPEAARPAPSSAAAARGWPRSSA